MIEKLPVKMAVVSLTVFDDKIAILREVFPEFRIRKGYEFVTYCPSARCIKDHGKDKMKLEINLRDNKFGCWRCHYSGSPLKLLKDYGNADKRKRYAKAMGLKLTASTEEENRIELPKEYKFVFDDYRSPVGDRARQYLIDLGVSEDSIFQNRIGFCDSGQYKGRILFPSFDDSGRLNYFVTRDLYQDGAYKWLNCAASMRNNIFNELFVDWSKPVILIESVKAYVKHFEMIDNLVCGNGTKISNKHKLFEQIVMNDVPKVFVAFDAEADEEAMKAMNEFYEYGIETLFVEFCDDIQPDQISSSTFLESISDAKEFEKNDILRNRIKKLI